MPKAPVFRPFASVRRRPAASAGKSARNSRKSTAVLLPMAASGLFVPPCNALMNWAAAAIMSPLMPGAEVSALFVP